MTGALVGAGALLGLALLSLGRRSSAEPAPPASWPSPPLPAPVHLRSRFGWRTDPLTGQPALHAGLDLGAPTGTPVRAPLDGRIDRVDRDGVGRGVTNGNAVFLRAGAHRWCFLHLSTVSVSPGQTVRRGQPLGRVGSTGRSTGPHLHLQVLDDAGRAVDPLPLFPPGTFTG